MRAAIFRTHFRFTATPALLLLPFAFLASGTSGCSAQRGGQPVPTGPDARLGAGDHEIQLAHDDRNRRYYVHVPTSVGDRPPVVVALHGGGGTGAQFKSDNELDPVSDREGFLAVYPDGTGPNPNLLLTWNAGFNCCGYARGNDVDDVGFLLAVLDDLGRHVDYDRLRVYVTGHSNGAIMAYRLAAEAADRVAAIVPVAGAMALHDPRPARAVPVLHIHSMDDPRALYDGGEGPPFPGTSSTVLHEPVGAGLDFWVQANGCDTVPAEVARRSGRGRDAGQTLTHLRWTGCSDGTVLEHMRMEGVGHGWPGTRSGPLAQRLLGPATEMIHASEEVWAFASGFSR